MASTWVGALLHKSRQHGKSPFPYQAAFMINHPVRRALLKPARCQTSRPAYVRLARY
jgi:hypothetical protein